MHIWTFVVGNSQDFNYLGYNCPCAPYPGLAAPHLHLWEGTISVNYDQLGNTGQLPYEFRWYLDDPLWDSQGCAANSTCCDRGSPWFATTLDQEASDDNEARMCFYHYENDAIGVNDLKIYINYKYNIYSIADKNMHPWNSSSFLVLVLCSPINFMQLIHCNSSPPSKVHSEVIVVAYCSGYISSHSSANSHLMQFTSVHSCARSTRVIGCHE